MNRSLMTAPQGPSCAGVVGRGPESALSVEHIDLFPTRVWRSRLNDLAPHFPAWVDAANALRKTSPEPAGRSNRLGWNSTDTAVLDRHEFDALHHAVRACCGLAMGQMGQGDGRLRLESWVNMHDRGGFNFLHMHEGALLSGVFYLQSPHGSGSLVFRDPRPLIIHAATDGAWANAHNEVHLQPEAGLIVLFPPWLEHYVEPHQNDVPRISISFNVL
jgi:uncharacterized protein (TIGR02466 family)